VFATFHFPDSAANFLTNPALDPLAKIPEFKVCAVKVDKLPNAGLDGISEVPVA
jgi:predicted molibdopterin-dependent oxidoreductase YjgC